jgi:uncharacterized membrane protein
MRKKKWLFLFVPVGIALFVFVGGEIVMHLWNWLLPGLFGWRLLTFWQAVGLLVLCRILFGSHGFRGGHRSRVRERIKERMEERWQHMTPEEREKARQRWGHCAPMPPPDSSPTT